jgi:predicted RNase H-like HicB family nuclease
MRTVSYTFWQDDDYFLGFLNEYPDYWTQGTSKEDLLENLRDILTDVESGEVPFVRKVEEMTVSPPTSNN